jgi:hypothetical protein
MTPGADSAAPEFTAALTRVVTACGSNGVQPGIAGTAPIARKRIEQGFTFVEVVNDAGLLWSASVSAVDLARPSGETPAPVYL